MTVLIIALLILIVFGLISVIFLLLKKKPEEKNEALSLIQQQINYLSQTLDNRLSESAKILQTQFGQSAKIIGEVTEKLVRLDETNKQVVDHTQKLLGLEDILKNSKQRGILGEFLLGNLLKNVLPPGQYQMQYSLGINEATGKELIIDAVIFVDKDKIIPVDSKFSLENYNRIAQEKDPDKREGLEKIFVQDLKNRIDETAKYIQPAKNTLDFALMFIPADGIYSDLLENKVGVLKSNTRDLISYAHEKKVIIVSPATFYAYLMTILQGLRAFKIQEFAQQIGQRVEILGKHIGSYEEYLKKIGVNLSATVSAYNNAYKEFGKIDKDVAKITGEKSQVEPKQLEKTYEE